MNSRRGSAENGTRKRNSALSDEGKKVNFLLEEPGKEPKRESLKDVGNTLKDSSSPISSEGSPKAQKKIITSWKLACDKTKDRTKELLKRWRTMPEGGMQPHRQDSISSTSEQTSGEHQDHGWSVHVWATWVKRYPSDDDTLSEGEKVMTLTPVQKDKLGHFFSHIFDMDRDDMISAQDIEAFSERLRHFADWTMNCGEYITLQEVQQGFIGAFILSIKPEDSVIDIDRLFLSLEDWIWLWNSILADTMRLSELPLWLQHFPKVLFYAINRSGTGVVTKEELSEFYSSVMGFPNQKVAAMIDDAFKSMTANGEMKLDYKVFKLCFANFLFGRFPNGPGQFVFGYAPKPPDFFPIDYSALNTAPEDREEYSPGKKSHRTSIIV